MYLQIRILLGGTIMRKRQKGKLTVKQIIELYKTKSIREIGEIDGTSNGTIIRYLHKANVKMRRCGNNEISKKWIKHGWAGEATKHGIAPATYVRMATLVKLGGKCCKCGIDDYRVLEINHINGEGRVLAGKSKGSRAYLQHLKVLADEINADLEVCCANCNILHEYERGNRTERKDLWSLLMLKLNAV